MKQEEIREGIESILSQSGDYPMSDSMEWDKDVAAEILSYLHSQGVVLRVDREIPNKEQIFLVAVESLIKEER